MIAALHLGESTQQKLRPPTTTIRAIAFLRLLHFFFKIKFCIKEKKNMYYIFRKHTLLIASLMNTSLHRWP
jgi:hypothetical protein